MFRFLYFLCICDVKTYKTFQDIYSIYKYNRDVSMETCTPASSSVYLFIYLFQSTETRNKASEGTVNLRNRPKCLFYPKLNVCVSNLKHFANRSSQFPFGDEACKRLSFCMLKTSVSEHFFFIECFIRHMIIESSGRPAEAQHPVLEGRRCDDEHEGRYKLFPGDSIHSTYSSHLGWC